jgi:hypothetical protein
MRPEVRTVPQLNLYVRSRCWAQPIVLDPDPDWIRDSIRSVDPDSESGSGSGSRRTKVTHKNWKKLRNFNFMF